MLRLPPISPLFPYTTLFRSEIPAALHLQTVEKRPVRYVIQRIQFCADQISGSELHMTIWPRADGLEVGWGLACPRASVCRKNVSRYDHAAAAEEGLPEWSRPLERHPDRM